MLTTHHHLEQTLGMKGAKPLLPLYTFMAWTDNCTFLTETNTTGMDSTANLQIPNGRRVA
jgi:hypothetical protein